MITDGRRGTFNKVCQSLHVPGALTYPWESVIQEHRGVEDKKDFVNDKKDCNCVNAFNKNSPNTLKAKRKQSPKASACRTLLKAELHISVNVAGEKLCRLQKNKWITLKQCPSTEKLACDNQNFQSSLFVMTETRKSDKQCELQPVCFLFFLFFFLPMLPDLLLRSWHPHTARCSSGPSQQVGPQQTDYVLQCPEADL